jgi:hypothetical protein
MVIASCATSGIQIKNSGQAVANLDSLKILKRFYVLGNASKANSELVLKSIQQKIEENTEAANHLIFVGDNINEKKEDKVKQDLDRIISLVKKTKTPANYLPGKHEWKYDGIKGLEIIEDYFEKELNDENILSPNNGCPLESIEISETVQLITVDSQWYLQNWDRFPGMNDKCEIKTREKLILEIEGELKKSANKFVIFAVHHPLFTNAVYGGSFSIREHLFPYGGNIPLPGLATLITEIRAQGGPSSQDRFNIRYKEFAQEMEALLSDKDQRILVVSGHEQNLQYIEEGAVKQLISGAAGDTTPAGLGNNGLFSYGGSGFSVVESYIDGSVKALFYSVDKQGNTTLLFEKLVFESLPVLDLSALPTNFPKTVTASVYDLEAVDKSDFFKSIWGYHYRQVYGTPVKARVAVLDTLYGGLEVERPGGGHQTRSLRLVTKDGKEYNMRALKKSATQFLGTTAFKGVDSEKYFSNTITEELISDFYTAAHPYAAFAIPKLAKAAGVFYTTPELYFVPKQERLGKYNEEYGDQLYMIVEKPTDEFSNRKSFGYSNEIESTDDLLQKLREDEDYILDEEAYIRARIFDMLLGDWDRHSDQWRWAEFENEKGKKVFVPIPRDRDQVFASFDGSLLNLLRSIAGSVNQFGIYGPDINDVRWFNAAGSKLDRALVKRSDKTVWLEQARFLQKAIDQTTLDAAFASLPTEVQDTTLQQIKRHFIGRKANLEHIVERYYAEFIEFQMLTGTDKDDHFDILRFPNGSTQIKAYRIKDGEKEDVLFDRTFKSEETEEIWLYGLDDKDVFTVTGDPKHAILIRIIGGQEKDTYSIAEGRRIKVYDRRSKNNEILEKGGAYFRLTNLYEANLYNYQKTRKTGGGIGANVDYNPDDGTIVKARYTKTVNKFIENPYGSKTELLANYHFLTQGLDLRFNKGYAAIFSDFNFVFNSRFTSKNYTENFFGFGNETVNPDDLLSLDYNRANLAIFSGGVGVERSSDYGSYFQLKLDIESVRLVRNGSNFVSLNLPSLIDNRSWYVIPNATYSYRNMDDTDFPSKGFQFNTTIGGIDNMDDQSLTGFLKSGIQFYHALALDHRLILSTKARTVLVTGDQPQFYQSATLGGDTGLRGYRNQRFTGRNSLAGSADIIYNLKKIKTLLFPLGISVYAGYDLGRVWIPNEASNLWYDSYGGGFNLQWTKAITGRFSAFTGDEGSRIEFGFGLNF